MNFYDFNKYKQSDRDGSYGGNSGFKEGVLINDEYWIIKYPKKGTNLKDVQNMSYTTHPVSEYIGSHIYEILGFDVHKTCLGIKNEHLVVACKDFLAENQKLLEFRQLKNTYNKQLNEKLDLSLSPTGSEHFVNLNEILIHLDYNPSINSIPGIKKRFWDCVIVDGFINNNDRNNGNWGIIRSKMNKDVLAPIFDNGASFSPNVPEYKIIHKLNNQEALIQSACSCITAYSLDGENNVLFRDILNLDNEELCNSIKRNVPLIKEKFSEIEQTIEDIPFSMGDYSIISKERKREYKQELEVRLNNLLIPAYERVLRLQKEQDKSDSNNLSDFMSFGDKYISQVLEYSKSMSVKDATHKTHEELVFSTPDEKDIKQKKLNTYLQLKGVNSNADFAKYISELKTRKIDLSKENKHLTSKDDDFGIS